MKRNFFCFLFILCSLFTFSQDIEQSKKYNLNLEEHDKERGYPEGWFKWGFYKDTGAEKDANDNWIGKLISDKEGKFGCIVRSIPANYIGDTIELKGYVKIENVKGRAGLIMRVDNYYSTLAFDNSYDKKIKGTIDWKEYSVKLPLDKKASHIYIGGILSGQGKAWFDNFSVLIDGKDIRTLKEINKPALTKVKIDSLVPYFEKKSKPIDFSSEDSLDKSLSNIVHSIGQKKIVAIGESTHGTSEFYKLREVLTKKLIKEKGFTTIILESPYDDIELLNKNLYNQNTEDIVQSHLLAIYHTEEMVSFVNWLRKNKEKYNIKFKGCDDSFWAIHKILNKELVDLDIPKITTLNNSFQKNITKFKGANHKKEFKYGVQLYEILTEIESVLKENNVLDNEIHELLVNAKTTYVNYYNISNNKNLQSRDEIMADRISLIANNTSEKVIVWAHNAHISNKAVVDNEIGLMGEDLKKEFNTSYHSIGLGAYEGTYSYIDDKFINGSSNYSRKLRVENLLESPKDSWESLFSKTSSKASITNFFNLTEKEDLANLRGPFTLLGYGKETKKDRYYVSPISMFDTYIFLKETTATHPLENNK